MHDLNLNLFYKTSFDIRCIDVDDGDALWELVMCVRRWICGKWRKRGVDVGWDRMAQWRFFKSGKRCSLGDRNGKVRFDSSAYWLDGGGALWACVIEETMSEPGFAPRHWVTEVGFSSEDRSAGRVSIVLSYGDRPGFLGPVQPQPSASIPNLVRLIDESRNLSCTVSGMPMVLGPIGLSVGGFPAFWDFVFDPEREAPVVYVSPRVSSDGSAALAVDPAALSAALGPSAFVYFSKDRQFCEEMAYLIDNRELGCTDGSVRIYADRPRFSEEGDARRHRFFRMGEIDAMGADALVATIRRAIAQDVNFYERMTRVGTIREKLRLQRVEGAAQKRAVDAIDANTDAAYELIEQAEDKAELLQDRVDELEATVDDLKRKLHDAESAKDSLRRALDAKGPVADKPSLGRWPMSPEGIAEVFLAAYPDRIDFTERGRKSLSDCSTDAGVLWTALYDLCTVAHDLYANRTGIDVAREFESRSKFEFARGAGSMTRKNNELMSQYRDEYRGRELSCETHIKNKTRESDSEFIRVYFGFDADSRKIVVSSCGRHFDVFSTRTIH